MRIRKSQLEVKRSRIPGAGEGLFTKVFIPRGTRICEYKGTVTNWKDISHENGKNRYILYVNRNHVIDAEPHPESVARYANDARGKVKIKGLKNNSIYRQIGLRIYIAAYKNIPAGSEILVGYGKEYWDTISEDQ
ncbi:MAG: hypothetical protein JWM28_3729 [Chitinophagaceae bacterium]|nr:hypothetical protein [Chitinophagaceae bacterium]